VRIHHFLPSLFVALWVGCGQAESDFGVHQHWEDDAIVEMSVAEAFGEGDPFGDESPYGADFAKAATEESIPDVNAEALAQASRIERLKNLTIWKRGLGDVSSLAKWKALRSLYLGG